MSQEKLKLDNKQKPLHKTITNNTFGIPVHLFVGEMDALRRYYERDGVKTVRSDSELSVAAARTLSYYDSFGQFTVLIWFREFNSEVRDFGHLAHEVVHATNAIFDHLNYAASRDNDEIQAYFTQYLLMEILKKLI